MRLEIEDRGTFDMLFGNLTVGYVIELNGKDMVVDAIFNEDGDRGIYGHRFDSNTGDADRSRPYGVDWDDIESVVIY